MQTIWGYGSLKLTNLNNSISVQFSNSIHSLGFEKQNYRQKAISTYRHQTQILYSPIIECKISICNASEVSKYITLIQLLNEYTTNGLVIYPQFSNSNTQNNSYECLLDSNVAFKMVSDTQVGQTIELQFIGRRGVKLPTNVSNAVISTMIDESGNTYVDESGNEYIMVGL